MNANKKKALEAAGFCVGDASDFLGLTTEESRLVDLRIAVSRNVRILREKGSSDSDATGCSDRLEPVPGGQDRVGFERCVSRFTDRCTKKVTSASHLVLDFQQNLYKEDNLLCGAVVMFRGFFAAGGKLSDLLSKETGKYLTKQLFQVLEPCPQQRRLGPQGKGSKPKAQGHQPQGALVDAWKFQ